MVDRYWIGDSGNYNDIAHWASISGGLGGESVPSDADAVIIDRLSTTGAGAVITVNVASDCLSFDMSDADFNSYHPTLTVNESLTSHGDIKLKSTCPVNGTAAKNLIIETAGAAIFYTDNRSIANIGFTMTGNGTVTLGEKLSIPDGGIYWTTGTGTFDDGGYDLTAKYFYAGAGKTINMAGTWTLTYKRVSAAWEITATTTLNYDVTAVIIISYAGTTTFTGAGKSHPEVRFTGAGGNYYISGSNTFTRYWLDPTKTMTVRFTDGTNQTIVDPVLSGNPTHIHTLLGTAALGWTITKAGGGTVTCKYMSIDYSIGSPAATWYARYSTDGTHNTDWTFEDVWAGTYLGVTNPDVINGLDVVNIAQVNGVAG